MTAGIVLGTSEAKRTRALAFEDLLPAVCANAQLAAGTRKVAASAASAKRDSNESDIKRPRLLLR